MTLLTVKEIQCGLTLNTGNYENERPHISIQLTEPITIDTEKSDFQYLEEYDKIANLYAWCKHQCKQMAERHPEAYMRLEEIEIKIRQRERALAQLEDKLREYVNNFKEILTPQEAQTKHLTLEEWNEDNQEDESLPIPY